MNDYQWYLYSCGKEGTRPISARRFRVLLDTYKRDFAAFVGLDLFPLRPRQRVRMLRRWTRLCEVARLADAGRGTITAGTVINNPRQVPPDDRPEFGGSGPKDDPPGAAPGVREPRRPIEPLLSGVGARPIPRPGSPSEPRWHAI